MKCPNQLTKLNSLLLKSFHILLFFIYNSLKITAQTSNIPITLQNLLADNKPISYISWENIKYVNIPDTPFHNFPQYLIKTSKGLFVFIDGSGRLYRFLNNGNNIECKRIGTKAKKTDNKLSLFKSLKGLFF